MHLNNTEDITDETIACFKKHEPIGCRDYATRDFLRSHGVEAYFSGCLTLTLGNTYRAPESERTNHIYFVDYQMGMDKNQKIDADIQKVLDTYPDCPISYLTHQYPKNNQPEKSLKEAEYLINRYARAGLVITRNIHCALPCLALNTPVILIVPTYDAKRFQGLLELFNFIGQGADGTYAVSLKKDTTGKIINDCKHVPYADYLTRLCQAFTGQTQTSGLSENIPCLQRQKPGRHYRFKHPFVYEKERDGIKRTITLLRRIHFSYTSKSARKKARKA